MVGNVREYYWSMNDVSHQPQPLNAMAAWGSSHSDTQEDLLLRSMSEVTEGSQGADALGFRLCVTYVHP